MKFSLFVVFVLPEICPKLLMHNDFSRSGKRLGNRETVYLEIEFTIYVPTQYKNKFFRFVLVLDQKRKKKHLSERCIHAIFIRHLLFFSTFV
jgi:hypothetical protein